MRELQDESAAGYFLDCPRRWHRRSPLTTAVLNSVDVRHTGFGIAERRRYPNRRSGLATALLGAAFAAVGTDLWAALHIAMAIAAATCAAAAVTVLGLLDH